MSNTQMFLAIGIPSFLVLVGKFFTHWVLRSFL
jgi:hypothetical protein